MKTLIRWTTCESTKEGRRCLHTAVRSMKKLISDADYVICHNNIPPHLRTTLPKIPLLSQDTCVNALPEPPKGPAWKLYPPRLRLNSHEIMLDNDLIIYKMPPLFNEFLESSNLIVVTEAYRRSYSGPLERLIPSGFNINSGVLCLPPGFDFKSRLEKEINTYGLEWNDHFDEQTLVAYVLSQHKNVKIIPQSEIAVSAHYLNFGTHGCHFVGLNSTNLSYWRSCEYHQLFY